MRVVLPKIYFWLVILLVSTNGLAGVVGDPVKRSASFVSYPSLRHHTEFSTLVGGLPEARTKLAVLALEELVRAIEGIAEFREEVSPYSDVLSQGIARTEQKALASMRRLSRSGSRGSAARLWQHHNDLRQLHQIRQRLVECGFLAPLPVQHSLPLVGPESSDWETAYRDLLEAEDALVVRLAAVELREQNRILSRRTLTALNELARTERRLGAARREAQVTLIHQARLALEIILEPRSRGVTPLQLKCIELLARAAMRTQ